MPDMSDPSTSLRIYPGSWLGPLELDRHFAHPDRPLDLDLGCGKGRFLVARAAAHPDTNVLGIDRMLDRIRKVDRKCLRRDLHNVRLLRVEGYYAVTYLLPAASVRTCFCLFPDPWPKKRHRHHRLFSPSFLNALHRSLRPGGVLHLATDHLPYFEEIYALLSSDPRFAPEPVFIPRPEERTDFELLYLGRKPIGRCSFRKG